ncbi:membrane protein [Salmonella enterica subsp. arizonae]|uniref:Membrane protein n=1 Tax=Salmonella enterica subsp. arizonae TaxID=59203 RepID=A0A3S4G2Z9_SALER|nr:membrane protein [Salmonella enterica subsp. arizonae]
MIKGCIAVSLGLLLLTGCRSHPEIPVSDAQSLVMESHGSGGGRHRRAA